MDKRYVKMRPDFTSGPGVKFEAHNGDHDTLDLVVKASKGEFQDKVIELTLESYRTQVFRVEERGRMLGDTAHVVVHMKS